MELPYEISYDITTTPPQLMRDIVISWDNITYNDHYIDNSQEIIESRFPGGSYDHIPGMCEVFETMELNLKVTPLEEWDNRGFNNNHENK